MKSTNSERAENSTCAVCGSVASPTNTIYFSREAKPPVGVCERCVFAVLVGKRDE